MIEGRRGRRVERQFGQDAGVDVADAVGRVRFHRSAVTAPHLTVSVSVSVDVSVDVDVGALRRSDLTVNALIHRMDRIGLADAHLGVIHSCVCADLNN